MLDPARQLVCLDFVQLMQSLYLAKVARFGAPKPGSNQLSAKQLPEFDLQTMSGCLHGELGLIKAGRPHAAHGVIAEAVRF